jgi:hypothetical protein
VEVLACLLADLGLSPERLFGHDELTDARADVTKICPGGHLPMPALRQDVGAALKRGPVVLELLW